jgi:hypothetical protein
MKKLIAIGGVIGLLAALGWYFWSKSNKPATPSVIEEFDTGRGRRLLTLVKGDVAAARQLVAEMRAKHPGKDREWCIGQAIAGIEGN